jgi:hypothetical protein
MVNICSDDQNGFVAVKNGAIHLKSLTIKMEWSIDNPF